MKVSVGNTRVDGAFVHLVPFWSARIVNPVAIARGSDTRRLMGGENYKPHTFFNQCVHHRVVTRSLWQPHRFSLTLKAVAKISQAPTNLCAQVAIVAQRQNRVPISLSDRVAMALVIRRAGATR